MLCNHAYYYFNKSTHFFKKIHDLIGYIIAYSHFFNDIKLICVTTVFTKRIFLK